MTPRQLRETFAEQPELLLALMLSTTDRDAAASAPCVTVDFNEDEVTARVQRTGKRRNAPRLLVTKETIFAAFLLYYLIDKRGADFADSLVKRAGGFAERAASHYLQFGSQFSASLSNVPPESAAEDTSSFLRELDVTADDLGTAQRWANETLAFLEKEGLVVDPAFTPELMLLAGFVPMHFSVRTPKGERLYRQITIDAPLWYLEITRGSKKGRPHTDVEFRFRGIEIVRKAITSMATHYLEAEEKVRRSKGQPILRRKGSPELDDE